MDGQSAQFRLHIPGHCANALLVPQGSPEHDITHCSPLEPISNPLARHRIQPPPRRSECRIPQESFFPVENPASCLANALRINRSRLKGETP